AKQRQRDQDAGYATDLISLQLKPLLREIASRGIRVVTNAGGINPPACARAVAALAAAEGIKVKVAVVLGDDLMPMQDDLRQQGITEMYEGIPLPAQLSSMNAYIGAFPIAAALDAGADIVITGRCAD